MKDKLFNKMCICLKKLFNKIALFNTPTQFTKIENNLFIVDCWNNRILFKSLSKIGIIKWNTIKGLNHPHRIIYLKNYYYIADTDNNRIVRLSRNLKQEKTIYLNIPLNKPHDLIAYKDFIYVIDSLDCNTRIIEINVNKNYSVETTRLIENAYSRSVKIINDKIIICNSSRGAFSYIDISAFKEGTINTYKNVIDDKALFCINHKEQEEIGYNRFIPNDIIYFQGYYYVTNYFYTKSKNRFIRFRNFDDYVNNNFEDISYINKGVPYFMEVIDGKIYLGEIDEYSRVLIIRCDNQKLIIEKIIEKITC